MTTTGKKTHFTQEERKFIMRVYGRILTPEEWEERQEKFAPDADEELKYDENGILIIA